MDPRQLDHARKLQSSTPKDYESLTDLQVREDFRDTRITLSAKLAAADRRAQEMRDQATAELWRSENHRVSAKARELATADRHTLIRTIIDWDIMIGKLIELELKHAAPQATISDDANAT